MLILNPDGFPVVARGGYVEFSPYGRTVIPEHCETRILLSRATYTETKFSRSGERKSNQTML